MAALHDSGGFDFDSWAALAANDPQAFEVKREIAIQAAIDAAPERNRERLVQLQWKLDRIRETSATPLAACVRLQELMWESLIGTDGLVERLNLLPEDELGEQRNTARVLVFPR